MKAQFASICPECEKPIHEGDEIANIGFVVGGYAAVWAHDECPPDPPKAKVCPLCFMEMALSGEHDCEDDR